MCLNRNENKTKQHNKTKKTLHLCGEWLPDEKLTWNDVQTSEISR